MQLFLLSNEMKYMDGSGRLEVFDPVRYYYFLCNEIFLMTLMLRGFSDSAVGTPKSILISWPCKTAASRMKTHFTA